MRAHCKFDTRPARHVSEKHGYLCDACWQYSDAALVKQHKLLTFRNLLGYIEPRTKPVHSTSDNREADMSIDLDAIRAHTITATPIPDGRGGLQYHCTTCGTLTYFQPPELPCLGSLAEAHSTIDRLRAEVARLVWDERTLSAELGFGDGLTEPAATLAEMTDPILEWMSDSKEYSKCPTWCELCGERLAGTRCPFCNGSGCGPGTALGAYEECPDCAGVGWVHEGCTQMSYADMAAEIERLSAVLDLARGWRDQATDWDEDTEQQISDGREIARLLGDES